LKTRRLICAVMLLAMIASTGCWDRREIENLAFISTTAIDRPERGDGIRVSTQIIKPFAFGPEDPGDLQERPIWLASAEGRTAGEASANLRDESPRTPFWAHNVHVILGEEFAREGVSDILGFFTRDPETRRRVHMMVVREARGEDLLHAEFELQRLPALGLERLLLAAERFIGTTLLSELHDFAIDLETEGIEPIIPALRIAERPPEGDIHGELQQDEIYGSIRLEGAAVFSGDQLVGWIDRGEARGVAWTRNEIQSTKIIIPHPAQENEHATLRVINANSEVDVGLTLGRPAVRVEIDVCADLVELTAPMDPFLDYHRWRAMEKALESAVEEEVRAALSAAQREYSSDVFGFGYHLARLHPEAWEDYRERWPEEFRNLPVHVQVRGEIKESGLLMRAPEVEDGE